MGQIEDGSVCMKLKCWGYSRSDDEQWDFGGGGRLKQILIWHGNYFNGMQIIYEKNNAPNFSEMLGVQEGNLENIHLEGPLTWMSVYNESGYNFISSLRFGNKEKAYGPFGREDGAKFSYNGKDEIVGFHGWFGKVNCKPRVTAVGLYIRINGNPSVGEKKPIKVEK